jgi:hypothetical protein
MSESVYMNNPDIGLEERKLTDFVNCNPTDFLRERAAMSTHCKDTRCGTDNMGRTRTITVAMKRYRRAFDSRLCTHAADPNNCEPKLERLCIVIYGSKA